MKGEVGSLKESQSFPYRISNGVLDFLAFRSVLKRAVRDRLRALCCTEFGPGLTTRVHPSGSMTEQLPRTRTTPHHVSSVWPKARRRREKKGGVVGSHSVIAPLSQGQMVAEQVAWRMQLSLNFGHWCDQCKAIK